MMNMMWALPLATGALSAIGASNKNDQMRRANKAAAEQTRYSAWSGLGQGQINNNYADPLMAGLGGGLQGASFLQGIGSLGGAADAAKDTLTAEQLQKDLTNPTMQNAFGSQFMDNTRGPMNPWGRMANS